ncbi:uncharacterized protein LOC119837712 [Zerene cesonia]|uniref:uncharacterized protein LOC119837712 n=1 Tax=Zerene cesonia TaxID=33412 RepID=UPI0018E4ECD3|nr:uncharacterized protein LOC119837712 [Zerene cesonia]
MDVIKQPVNSRNRFLKLSLKKNKTQSAVKNTKPNQSSEVIILDESYERLRSDFPKNFQSSPKIYSPITINDSCELSLEELPEMTMNKEPSKSGNVSLNLSQCVSPVNNNESKPSNGGWSPAQNIICATPRYEQVPSTPKDVTCESQQHCSIKEIQNSHHKLLNDIYGDVWKSIPKLFSKTPNRFNGVSKQLHYDDDDSDKENIRSVIKQNRELYLTESDKKQMRNDVTDSEKKSKKKLYTEKVANTPDVPKPKIKITRDVQSTTKKKKKGMTVTELVQTLDGVNTLDSVDVLTKRVQNVAVTVPDNLKRLSFMGSLADNTPHWRCHPEALQYHDNYKELKDQLARRLFKEFNKCIYDDALDADLPILWDTKLRTTAGTTTNRLIKNSRGERVRAASVKLSVKVLDAPQRLRDTLAHELCHAATWLLDEAKKSVRVFPELGEISRCHDMEIHYKYCYKCTRCGYSIKRHSKSIDVTKKCCGYCRGTFEIIVNRKNKDGVVLSAPARRGAANQFALYVKQNYGALKNGRTHAQVMKMLGEQFSATKGRRKEECGPDL